MDDFTRVRLATGALLGLAGGLIILWHCRRFWLIRIAKKDAWTNWLLIGIATPFLVWSTLYILMLVGVMAPAEYPPYAQLVLPVLEICVIRVALKV